MAYSDVCLKAVRLYTFTQPIASVLHGHNALNIHVSNVLEDVLCSIAKNRILLNSPLRIGLNSRLYLVLFAYYAHNFTKLNCILITGRFIFGLIYARYKLCVFLKPYNYQF